MTIRLSQNTLVEISPERLTRDPRTAIGLRACGSHKGPQSQVVFLAQLQRKSLEHVEPGCPWERRGAGMLAGALSKAPGAPVPGLSAVACCSGHKPRAAGGRRQEGEGNEGWLW